MAKIPPITVPVTIAVEHISTFPGHWENATVTVDAKYTELGFAFAATTDDSEPEVPMAPMVTGTAADISAMWRVLESRSFNDARVKYGLWVNGSRVTYAVTITLHMISEVASRKRKSFNVDTSKWVPEAS